MVNSTDGHDEGDWWMLDPNLHLWLWLEHPEREIVNNHDILGCWDVLSVAQSGHPGHTL